MDRKHSPIPSSANVAVKQKRSWRKRMLLAAIFGLYVLVLAEVSARGYWRLRYDVPFFDTTQIWSMRFYPELRDSKTLESSVTRDDKYYDVLLLGASVVSTSFGDIGQQLETQLSELTGQPARVFNCSSPALTTRDSLLKYQKLDDKQFDLVVVYHGINDARMNNCPPGMFRSDYTHSAWYYRVAALDRHPEFAYWALPYTLEHIAVSFGQYLPKHQPPDGWSRHGEIVKTVDSFYENVSEIIKLAKQRNADVLLPSYAWHLTDDYSLPKFRKKQLDYGSHAMAVELIGTPRGVSAAVTEHNQAIRRLTNEHANVVFADLNGLMPKDGKHFDDICHLTQVGCTEFVKLLRQPLIEYLRHERGNEDLGATVNQRIALQNAGNSPRR